MNQRTQIIVLIAVVAVGLAVIAWQREQQAPPLAAEKGRKTAQASSDEPFMAEDVPIVRFVQARPLAGEDLERQKQRGNLFVYTRSPEEIAEEQRILEEQRKAAEEARIAAEKLRAEQAEAARIAREEQEKKDAAARAWALANPPPPPPPVPPTFRYQYIGIIGPKDDALAILSDGGTKYAYARTGDVIDDAFRVERVTSLSLDMTYLDPRFADQFEQVARAFAAVAPPGAVDRATPATRKQR